MIYIFLSDLPSVRWRFLSILSFFDCFYWKTTKHGVHAIIAVLLFLTQKTTKLTRTTPNYTHTHPHNVWERRKIYRKKYEIDFTQQQKKKYRHTHTGGRGVSEWVTSENRAQFAVQPPKILIEFSVFPNQPRKKNGDWRVVISAIAESILNHTAESFFFYLPINWVYWRLYAIIEASYEK